MNASVTFWGTRGTIPTPGPHTARYGGNTPCVEVRDSAGHLVILDAGTGIRSLGRQLQATAGPKGVRADIIVTHAHWDHIQGLPYFAPFFVEGNTLAVWGPKQGDVGMETILKNLMQPVVFPVPLEALAATLEVKHVGAEPIAAPGCTITAMRMRHPSVTMGYRLLFPGGKALVYVSDDEMGSGGDYPVGPKWRDEFVAFIGDAELLIHDSMYTPEEYPRYQGWGHSTYAETVELALDSGAKRVALFHHEPEHADSMLDEISNQARELAGRRGRLEVVLAAEGMKLTI